MQQTSSCSIQTCSMQIQGKNERIEKVSRSDASSLITSSHPTQPEVWSSAYAHFNLRVFCREDVCPSRRLSRGNVEGGELERSALHPKR
jgi:hypothetical protein